MLYIQGVRPYAYYHYEFKRRSASRRPRSTAIRAGRKSGNTDERRFTTARSLAVRSPISSVRYVDTKSQLEDLIIETPDVGTLNRSIQIFHIKKSLNYERSGIKRFLAR